MFTYTSPIFVFSNVKSLLIVVNFRSPCSSFREASILHRVEFICDHPQILFQYLIGYESLSNIESRIFQYFRAAFWRNSLISLTGLYESILEPALGNATRQDAGGDIQTGLDGVTIKTAEQEHPGRGCVVLNPGLVALHPEERLLHEPAEATQQLSLSQVEDSSIIEACAGESEDLLWDLSGMRADVSNEQVGLQISTEDYDEQNLLQDSDSEKLQRLLEERTVELQKAEAAREKAKQESADLGNAIKILWTQVNDVKVALKEQKEKYRNLQSQSQTEMLAEKARADAAEQKVIKLQQEHNRCVQARQILQTRLNDAQEDKKKRQEEYNDLRNVSTTQFYKKSGQIQAKLRQEYEETIEDYQAKQDLNEEILAGVKANLNAAEAMIDELQAE